MRRRSRSAASRIASRVGFDCSAATGPSYNARTARCGRGAVRVRLRKTLARVQGPTARAPSARTRALGLELDVPVGVADEAFPALSHPPERDLDDRRPARLLRALVQAHPGLLGGAVAL